MKALLLPGSISLALVALRFVLAVGVVLILAFALFLRRPSKGRVAGPSERERLGQEDALKRLWGFEYGGGRGTSESLAGALEVGRGHAARILAALVAGGLARVEGQFIQLTERGRKVALTVLRRHRLWERYLADRTGVGAAEWHERAERAEHALRPQDTEALSTRLGHPLYDPHGDPIPTPDGDVPPPAGIPLTRVPAGRTCLITHLEDEPREVFERLLAAQLAPGLSLRVVDVRPTEVRVLVEGRERSLDPVASAAVTVALLEGDAAAAAVVRGVTLADLAVGEVGSVLGISPACVGSQRRRLLDLGVVPGTRVGPELVSAAGEPVAYRIRGALIALRKEQAAQIRVERLPDGVLAAQPASSAVAAAGLRPSGPERARN